MDKLETEDTDDRISDKISFLKNEYFGDNKYRPIYRHQLVKYLANVWLHVSDLAPFENAKIYNKMNEHKKRMYKTFITWTDEALLKKRYSYGDMEKITFDRDYFDWQVDFYKRKIKKFKDDGHFDK